MSEFKLENLHALMEQRRLQLEITREQLAVQVGVSLQELTSSDPRWSTLSRMLEWSGCLLLEFRKGAPAVSELCKEQADWVSSSFPRERDLSEEHTDAMEMILQDAYQRALNPSSSL